MVLTDREILTALKTKQIEISPAPKPDALSSTSVDLTLSPQVRIWRPNQTPGVERVVCPAAAGYDYNKVAREHTDTKVLDETGYVLKPGAFLLAWTAERLRLPFESRIAARVEGKSSLARLGIARAHRLKRRSSYGGLARHPDLVIGIQLSTVQLRPTRAWREAEFFS